MPEWMAIVFIFVGAGAVSALNALWGTPRRSSAAAARRRHFSASVDGEALGRLLRGHEVVLTDEQDPAAYSIGIRFEKSARSRAVVRMILDRIDRQEAESDHRLGIPDVLGAEPQKP